MSLITSRYWQCFGSNPLKANQKLKIWFFVQPDKRHFKTQQSADYQKQLNYATFSKSRSVTCKT
jgi:hypothetical protein